MRPRNFIVNIEREYIYFDLPRAVSIFSELHVRISARVRFLRALQNWKARAELDAKLQRHSFPRLSREIPF